MQPNGSSTPSHLSSHPYPSTLPFILRACLLCHCGNEVRGAKSLNFVFNHRGTCVFLSPLFFALSGSASSPPPALMLPSPHPQPTHPCILSDITPTADLALQAHPSPHVLINLDFLPSLKKKGTASNHILPPNQGSYRINNLFTYLFDS